MTTEQLSKLQLLERQLLVETRGSVTALTIVSALRRYRWLVGELAEGLEVHGGYADCAKSNATLGGVEPCTCHEDDVAMVAAEVEAIESTPEVFT